MRENGFDQDGSSAGRKKEWSDFRYIFKVDKAQFVNRLDGGQKTK